jgi:hypothetical protein
MPVAKVIGALQKGTAMTDAEEPEPTGLVAGRGTFWVTAYDLVVTRGMARQYVVENDTNANHAVSISGVALAVRDEVCVNHSNAPRRTKFKLTIREDRKAKEEWDLIKRELSLHREGHIDEEITRRIRDSYRTEFATIPPTASLYIPEQFAKEWCIDVQIPPPVLEQFVADLSDSKIEKISIGLEWVGGFSKEEKGLGFEFLKEFGVVTWCLIGGSEDMTPEPLIGRVSRFDWNLMPSGPHADHPSNRELEGEAQTWLYTFEKNNEHRTIDFLRSISGSIVDQCSRAGYSVDLLHNMLDEAANFILRLDKALHQDIGPFQRDQGLWFHRSTDNMIAMSKADFINTDEIGDILTEYIRCAWIHHPYLDWLLVDVSTFCELSIIRKRFMEAKHGISYTLSDGVNWKIPLWKLGIKSLGFLLGWVLPAVIFYRISASSPWVAVGLGAAWYGLAVIGVSFRLAGAFSQFFSRLPSSLQRMEQQLEEAESVYALLAGPVLHIGTIGSAFDRAAKTGVLLDQRIFYLLDRVRQQGFRLWTTVIN